jgi:hypothetical protein
LGLLIGFTQGIVAMGIVTVDIVVEGSFAED